MGYVLTDLETGEVYTGQIINYDVDANGTGLVLLDGAVVLNVPGIGSFEQLEAVFLQEFQVVQM